jgi:hypothetical protein
VPRLLSNGISEHRLLGGEHLGIYVSFLLPSKARTPLAPKGSGPYITS